MVSSSPPRYRDKVLLLVLALSAIELASPSWGAGESEKITAKFGYFDIKELRARFADSVQLDAKRRQGEAQLRQIAIDGNLQLNEYSNAQHTAAEIQTEKKKLQDALDAKTRTFVQQMLAANLNLTEKIKRAADSVAQSHGLDIIVDATAVYKGGSRLLKDGMDVTMDLVKVLGTEPTN